MVPVHVSSGRMIPVPEFRLMSATPTTNHLCPEYWTGHQTPENKSWNVAKAKVGTAVMPDVHKPNTLQSGSAF